MNDEPIRVTFEAFLVPDGTGPLDIRIIIPKSKYIIAAEDTSCYYVQPIESIDMHLRMSED